MKNFLWICKKWRENIVLIFFMIIILQEKLLLIDIIFLIIKSQNNSMSSFLFWEKSLNNGSKKFMTSEILHSPKNIFCKIYLLFISLTNIIYQNFLLLLKITKLLLIFNLMQDQNKLKKIFKSSKKNLHSLLMKKDLTFIRLIMMTKNLISFQLWIPNNPNKKAIVVD